MSVFDIEITLKFLSYVPLYLLPTCALVCNNWYLITKYHVTTPLIDIRSLALGELVYWIPGENSLPKMVLLKVNLYYIR